MARKVIEAHVVRWERSQGTWGVAVRYDDHTRETWPVGDRGAAKMEVASYRLNDVRLLQNRPLPLDGQTRYSRLHMARMITP